jgi:hypothetical protein
MRTISGSFVCAQLPTKASSNSSDADLARWARAVIRDPRRYGADQRVGAIVADLLVRFEASR